MATTLNRSIVVPGDIAAAFDYIADFSNAAEWDPGIETARRTSPGPIATGATFELVAEFMGRNVVTNYEVLEHEPPHRVVFRGGTSVFTSTDTIVLTKTGDDVHIDYGAVFELHGLLRLAEPFLRSTFHKLADKAVAGLEATLRR
jgi:carbon monoxide dehydrogenase subunit G